VVENLANESAAAIDVAKSKNLHYIDLNRASTDYVNKLGQKNADLYNLAGPKTDRTHVNTRGEKVFARMVSDLLVAKYPNEFKEVTKPDAALSAKIKNGELA
jgi:lysophospholipase L1-like esterase